MPCHGFDFYEDQINIAKRLVENAGQDALVIMTLYSPFMCAGQTVGKSVLEEHLRENPYQTKKGIEIITESLMIFVKDCVTAGIDGFYHSTQGGETSRFEGSHIFDEIIKPYDLILMKEIERVSEFNILHICDYEGSYKDLTPFLEYPGHVVNTNLQLGNKTIKAADVSRMFGRPFMGGMDRHGVIATGSLDDIRETVNLVCKDAPEKFILGADCTLPGDCGWHNIKCAIDTAHQIERDTKQ
jgi:uroporphyrinogen decarboxylase